MTRALESDVLRSTEGTTFRALESYVAAGVFAPSDIAGLFVWYDPSDAASLTLNGSNVTAITAKSGYGPALTGPPTGILKGAKGALSTLQVTTDGTPGISGALSSAFTSNSLTLSVAAYYDDITVYGRLASIDGAVLDWDNTDSAAFGRDAGVFPALTRNSTVISGTHIPNAWHVFTWIINNGAVTIYSDGVAVATGTTSTATLNASRFGLVSQSSGTDSGSSWRGHIGEVAVYNRALTATERGQVEQYLVAKWLP